MPRQKNRSIDSDPATRSALSVPKELELSADPGGLHTTDEDARLDTAHLDDEATAMPLEKPRHHAVADARNPEELGAEVLARALQGGGTLDDEEDAAILEERIDRDALAAGIVPQLVSQASLESASMNDGDDDEDALDDLPLRAADPDLEPTVPRARTRHIIEQSR